MTKCNYCKASFDVNWIRGKGDECIFVGFVRMGGAYTELSQAGDRIQNFEWTKVC